MQWQQQQGVNMQTANQYGQQPVQSIPVVTKQPGSTGSTLTRPKPNMNRPVVSLKARHGGRSRVARPATPAHEVDSDSESNYDNDDLESVVYDDDDDYMSDDECQETSSSLKEDVKKLSEKFATSRIDPILRAARDEFGLEPDDSSDDDEGACSLRFGGIGVDNDTRPPVIRMPRDIHKEKKKVATKSWGRFPNRIINQAFKVPRADHDALFVVPQMDKEASAALPKKQRKASTWCKPFTYSPYWEQQLYQVDAHLRSMTRLSAFQLTMINYLLTMIEDDDSDAGMMATTTLVNDITVQQVKSTMQLSKHMTALRRENVIAFLRKEYVDEVPANLIKLPYVEESVFGGSFGKTIRSLAKKKRDQSSLESDLRPLSYSASSKRKNNGGRAIRNAQDQPSSSGTGSSNRGKGNYRGRGGRGGKRNATSRRPPAAAGGPPNAKKARGGSQQHF